MTTPSCDILISGGGIAGMTAAAAFGTAGFDVICVDPAPPITERDTDGSDMRSTAFLQPAQRLLDRAGLWPQLADHAAPLQIMRIVDAGGAKAEPRASHDFKASDVSDQPFGWNFPNWLLRRELQQRLKTLPNVDFHPGTRSQALFTRSGEARVTLSDGRKIRTRLVIAADGRNSFMREAAGINVSTRRYGQKALAFCATHPIAHENVSTEIHRSGGPFTLVPLPDFDGSPCSAIVWMDDGPLSQRRMALDPAAFNHEISERSCHLFGPLTLASQRTIWPIISQHAERLSSQRLALIAEAAHVVPPIGAQGLNMSLADTAMLLDLAQANPQDLGDRAMLDQYHAARLKDIRLRVQGIDLLNRASQAQSQPLRDARAMGLGVLHNIPQLRKSLMQMGLGVR